MKPLVITNVEMVEDEPFFIIALYDEGGNITDQIALPYESPRQVMDKVADLAVAHSLYPVDLWTSNRDIYAATLKIEGINGEYRVPQDTDITEIIIKHEGDKLKEIYDIQPREKATIPDWKLKVIYWLEKIIKKLKGDEKHG